MHYFGRALTLLACIVACLFPFSAFAITPVGGMVTFMRPCNTGYLITVVNPMGIGSGEYMWTPGTIDFLYGPPTIHRWVLGMSDVPAPCVIGHVVYGWGQRITFDGTSLPTAPGAESAGESAVLSGHGLY